MVFQFVMLKELKIKLKSVAMEKMEHLLFGQIEEMEMLIFMLKE